MRSDLKKLDSFTSETSKNHLIRNFLRNGRLRVKHMLYKKSFLPVREISPEQFSIVEHDSCVSWSKNFITKKFYYKHCTEKIFDDQNDKWKN